MPNAKVLETKKQIVKDLAEKMKTASSGVLVDYKGINVESDTKLRSEMRSKNVDYSVVKNTLVRFAANEIGFEALDEVLHGTTALAISMDNRFCRQKSLLITQKKLHKELSRSKQVS